MSTINEYFDGNVKSLGYQSTQGKSTVGVMDEGQYRFSTTMHETMTVIEGHLDILLQGEEDWKEYIDGQSFEVKANSSFEVKSSGQTAYLCKYK